MSDSPIFELVCERVPAGGVSLPTRGTRHHALLLKELGLDPQRVGKGATTLATDRFFEQALRVRGVAEPALVKARVLQSAAIQRARRP